MSWKILAIKKAVKKRLPLADSLRKVKRNIFGYLPNTSNLEATIRSYEKIKKSLVDMDSGIEGATVLEIGSGWFPVLPILMARDGAKKILMSDLNVHMDEVTFQETTKFLRQQFPDDLYIQELSSFSALPIEYMAPFEPSQLEDGTVDIILSHNVLEHIPKSDLFNLFAALRSKISESGAMIHQVDHSDHFEHYDKNISKVNFLLWSHKKHAYINCLVGDGENRLRHHEYYEVFKSSGYEVIDEQFEVDSTALAELENLNLASPYSNMKYSDLAVLSSVYLIKPI